MSELSTPAPQETPFAEVLALIAAARQRAYQAVNTSLIDLYWRIGEHISRKVASTEWGAGVVDDLARKIATVYPGQRGFTRSNLLRMRQFHETYRDHAFVAPLVRLLPGEDPQALLQQGGENVVALLRQLPWTHHVTIFGQCKRPEEREFYLRLAIREKWSSRELERQLRAALFERTVLSPPQMSPMLAQMRPDAASVFRDSYALSRTLTPALIAEYQTQLPDKKLLQQKLHEFYQLNAPEGIQS